MTLCTDARALNSSGPVALTASKKKIINRAIGINKKIPETILRRTIRLQRSHIAEVKHGEEETGIDAVAETVKPNGIVVAALPEKIGDRPEEVVPTGVRPATSCGSASG